MEYFPATLSRQESDQMMKRMQAKIEERGWGWWPVSLMENEKFIGFIGMHHDSQDDFDHPILSLTSCMILFNPWHFSSFGTILAELQVKFCYILFQ